MRRRMLFGSSGNNFSDAVVGDILCANESGNKIMIKDTSELRNGYKPIGVVVIPSSHDVYGTGERAVMSLNAMSYSTPDVGCSGTSHIELYWGGYGVNTSLPDLNVANKIGSTITQTDNIEVVKISYLPSDSYTGATCVKDNNAKYYDRWWADCAPSPYLTDGSRNPQYYDTSASWRNALADFNGVSNTATLVGLATGQSGWQTADTITNNTGATFYPAACCCWRYSTVGTSQGDWYLPACGELGYVVARLNKINEALTQIYDSQLVEYCSTVPTGGYFWSSTEHITNYARFVGMDSGGVHGGDKNGGGYVRAFYRV